MQFNYTKERKQFDEEWKKMRGEYRVAGMSEENIQIMYEFDLMAFRQRRTYCLHNESREEMEEKQNPIYRESIHFEDIEQLSAGRNNWLDELDNKKLYEAIAKLKKEDIEILTLWAIERYSVTEIAKMQKVSQQAVSKKVSRILRYLKKAMESKN